MTLLRTFTCGLCTQAVEGIPFGPVGKEFCHSCWMGRLDGMQLVAPEERVWLPDSMRCPECTGELYAEVAEWGTGTGIPTEAGIRVVCDCGEAEDHLPGEFEWRGVDLAVLRWMQANVRVIG